MPIFEYRCQACGHVFEQFTQRANTAGPPACPACGKRGVERVPSVFSGRASESGCAPTSSGGG
jgi:putative FmdB family regulatory protein